MASAALLVEQNWNATPRGATRATNSYAAALLEHSDIELTGVHGKHRGDPPLALPGGLPTIEIPLPGKVLIEGWNRSRRPDVDRWIDADVVHAPNYVLPATSKPLVATIHDLALLRHPEWFTPTGVAVFLRFFKRVIEENLSVFVPSQATADDCAFRGISERRIHVIPWGIDVEPAGEDEIELARNKYQLPDEFVLFVGTLEPRKNLRTLSLAMKQHGDLPLLVAGPTDWGDTEVPNARMLGRIPEGEIEPLIAAATMLAYPSHLEGFGLPVLEAMGQRTPVVTTKGTAPADILADAGLAVDTRSPKAIADAIGQLRSNPAEREAMGRLGRDRAKTYRWEATAKRAAATYEMLS